MRHDPCSQQDHSSRPDEHENKQCSGMSAKGGTDNMEADGSFTHSFVHSINICSLGTMWKAPQKCWGCSYD